MDISINEIESLIKHHTLHIYIDIDGVVYKSIDACVELLDKRFNKITDSQSISSWNFSCAYDNLTPDDIEWMFSTDEFFSIVEFQDGVLDFLHKHRKNITFVTKGWDKNIQSKIDHFNQYDLGDIPLIGLPLDVSKSVVDMSGGIFIDDAVVNLNESNARYKFLFKEYDNYTEWSDGWKGLILRSWK